MLGHKVLQTIEYSYSFLSRSTPCRLVRIGMGELSTPGASWADARARALARLGDAADSAESDESDDESDETSNRRSRGTAVERRDR